MKSQHSAGSHIVIGAGDRSHPFRIAEQLLRSLDPRLEREIARHGPGDAVNANAVQCVGEAFEAQRGCPMLRRAFDESEALMPEAC